MLLQYGWKSSRKRDKPLNFQWLHRFCRDIQLPENIEDGGSAAAITA
jgi:hypothetical protein